MGNIRLLGKVSKLGSNKFELEIIRSMPYKFNLKINKEKENWWIEG